MDASEINRVVEAVLAGRSQEFSKLVRAFGLPIRAYLHARIHHAEDAEDLAQETFIAAFRSLADFDRSRDFGAWLTGIARHRMLEHFRAHGRRLGAIERFREEVGRRVEAEAAAFSRIDSTERLERLLDCIGRLPAKLKQVVRAHLTGTRSSRLAKDLNTSPGAIYTMQWRANRILRECMEEHS